MVAYLIRWNVDLQDAEAYAANWENRVELSQSQGSDTQASKRARTGS